MSLTHWRDAVLRTLRARKDAQIDREVARQLAEMAAREDAHARSLCKLRRQVYFTCFVDRHIWRSAAEPMVTVTVAEYLEDWYAR